MRNILFILVFLGITSCSSISGSEEKVREYLLTITPIGISLSELIEKTKLNKWKTNVFDNGFGIKLNNGKKRYESFRPDIVVGVKSVKGYLGYYQGFPFRVDVTAYWAIDKHNKVTDLIVQKQYDGL